LHNTALHPADDAALAFATFLRRNALQYDAGAGEWGEAEEITISGDDMQRWVLKVFLNHAVTGHFEVQQRKDVTFPPEAVDILLDRAAWPSTWAGLEQPWQYLTRIVAAAKLHRLGDGGGRKAHQLHVGFSATPHGHHVQAAASKQGRTASRKIASRTTRLA
jgi:hypothetical protein